MKEKNYLKRIEKEKDMKDFKNIDDRLHNIDEV